MQVIVVSQELKEQASQLHSHRLGQMQLDGFLVRDLEVPDYLRKCDEPEDPFW